MKRTSRLKVKVDVGWFGWIVPHQEPLKSHHGQRWTFQPRSLEISPASPDFRNQPENINLNLVPKVEVVTSSRVHGTLHMATRPVKPQSRLRIALLASSMYSQVRGNAGLIREGGLPGRAGNACHFRCSSPNRYPKVPQFQRNYQPRGIRKYPNFHFAGLSGVVPETLRRSLVRS
jgi:hypothetical protein